jgi:proline iminopeptidase
LSDATDALYPPCEPFRADWLAVGDGHQLYFEECGRPDGRPVVYLHGGPGSGCTPAQRRFFDPACYRAVLFDQRGCGRSRAQQVLDANTTAHLVEDLERLRTHLRIERWIVFGGSWGSTVALAYARRYPQRVQHLVLRGVFLARVREVESFAYNLRAFLPEAWHALARPFGVADEQAARDFDLASASARTILQGAPDAAREIASAWLRLESEAMAMTVSGQAAGPIGDPLCARTRIYMHYLFHRFFLRDGELLEGLDALHAIPVDIVQGALDPVCPPISAWELAARLPQARLHKVALAGHGAFEAPLSRVLVSVMDGLRPPQ